MITPEYYAHRIGIPVQNVTGDRLIDDDALVFARSLAARLARGPR